MTFTAPPEWQFRGHCLNTTVNMFPEHPHGVALAIAVCRPPGAPVCPVIDACRQHALDNHELYGVWGGMSMRGRAKVRRKTPCRSGGRPLPAYESRQDAEAAHYGIAYQCELCGKWHQTRVKRAVA